jgi:hypothetical protein
MISIAQRMLPTCVSGRDLRPADFSLNIRKIAPKGVASRHGRPENHRKMEFLI